jgi:hypothetical protein
VNQFHHDASAQVEGLEGHSEEGLGIELFKALTDVLMVAFPEEVIIEKMAGEALKGFRDVMIAGISQVAHESSAGRLAHAKDELRRVLNNLTAATSDGATAGWHDGTGKLPASLDAFFHAHPEHKHDEFGADASWWEGYICDQIGIRDAAVADPSPQIVQALWTSFHTDFYRISAQVKWADRDFYSKVQFLAEMEASQRHDFLVSVGEDPQNWQN